MTVLERGQRLLARQIDERCSELVHNYFDAIGLRVLYGAETVALRGEGAETTAVLKDGRELPSQVFLAAVGIRPQRRTGPGRRDPGEPGIVVDDRMATSVPGVFAAGDIAEHNGMVLGLWPIAAKQGEVAAANALGGDERPSKPNPSLHPERSRDRAVVHRPGRPRAGR